MNSKSLNFGFGLRRRRCPVVLQSQAAECGLASLAMVAGYHGYRVDLATLRSRFSVSMQGMTLADITAAADRVKLGARAVRLEVEELDQLSMPCILHWNFNHFVVLVGLTRTGVEIHDPARGRRLLTLKEVSASFTGVALELTPTPAFERREEVRQLPLRELFGQVRGLGRSLLVILLLSVCLEVFVLLMPAAFQVVVDQVIVGADVDLLALVCVALVLLVVFQTLATVARSWALMTMGTSLGLQWATGLFGHLMRLPVSYFETRHTGDVVSRFGALDVIQNTFSTDAIRSVLDGIMVIGTCALMYLYGGWMIAVVLASTAIYLVMRSVFFGPYRRATDESIQHKALESSHFLETVRGISSLKMLNLDDLRRSYWLNLKVESLNAGLRIQKLDILFGALNSTLFGLDRVLLIYLGAGAVIAGNASVGALIAFLTYRELFRSRIVSLTNATLRFRMLGVHRARLADILYTDTEAMHSIPKPVAMLPGAFRGELSLEGVGFRYGETEDAVLENVNLRIESGEAVVLTGPSGCGKTTLMRIMSGLLMPTQGVVRLDGEDLRSIGPAVFRAQCACVMQEDQLFAGSIAQNICCFVPGSDIEEIRRVARLAAMDEEIMRLPMGYETLVGDMGSVLSGGQKQRLFLARALFRKPRILFLDESTSHLDENNESAINEAVEALSITRIMIAHRPSTIALATRQIPLGSQLEHAA